jgi:hypothetical protein
LNFGVTTLASPAANDGREQTAPAARTNDKQTALAELIDHLFGV